MPNRILITGATGNIGSNIVKELNGTEAIFYEGVTSVDKDDSSNNKVVIDFGSEALLINAFKDMDILFLVFPMVDSMVDFARNAVSAAQKTGIKHIVRSSGAGADSTLDFKMPRVQGTIDDIIKDSGIDYTLTKPVSFMQNFVNFFSDDIKRGVLFSPTGDGKVGWVDVRDIASVNATVLQDPKKFSGQELTITGPQNLSFPEALGIISEVTGKTVKYVDVPEEAAVKSMIDLGVPKFVVDMTTSLNRIVKAGYAEGITDTVKSVTGKDPIDFNEFVMDYKENWL